MAEFVLNHEGKPKAFAVADAAEFAVAIWQRAKLSAVASVIVYVHGRDMKPLMLGNDGEPKSSFKEGIVAELEAAGTVVAMVHWPHHVPIATPHFMPIQNALDAGSSISTLITALAIKKPNDLPIPVVLVTHSMGSIVLQSAAQGSPAAGWSSLTQVVIAAAASDIASSRAWIEKLGVRTYVMMNSDDGTLQSASNGGPFLGLQRGQEFPAAEIADNAVYFDISDLHVGHRYFVKAGSHGNAADLDVLATRIFKPAYRGSALNLSTFAQIDAVGKIFKLA